MNIIVRIPKQIRFSCSKTKANEGHCDSAASLFRTELTASSIYSYLKVCTFSKYDHSTGSKREEIRSLIDQTARILF